MKVPELEQEILNFIQLKKEILDLNIPDELSVDSPLFGTEGFLNSITLIHLVIYLENLIKSKTGINYKLLTNKTMSLNSSPFSTVSNLAKFIELDLKK